MPNRARGGPGSTPHTRRAPDPNGRVVIGYHGTSAESAAAIIAGAPFVQSQNNWDWLGDGIYFWEDAPLRAWDWAEKHYEQAAVLEARIRLGVCLNLTDMRFTSILQVAYHHLKTLHVDQGEVLPTNRGKARYLDCLVVNYVTANILPETETIRGTFIEGAPIFDTSGIFTQSHIQICVRRVGNINAPVRLHLRG